VVSGVVHGVFVKWVARMPFGELNSNEGKLRLVVCTVWCDFGSTDLGGMCSVGEG
jgi:hypothetical protein